jgi:hypothetical protein
VRAILTSWIKDILTIIRGSEPVKLARGTAGHVVASRRWAPRSPAVTVSVGQRHFPHAGLRNWASDDAASALGTTGSERVRPFLLERSARPAGARNEGETEGDSSSESSHPGTTNHSQSGPSGSRRGDSTSACRSAVWSLVRRTAAPAAEGVRGPCVWAPPGGNGRGSIRSCSRRSASRNSSGTSKTFLWWIPCAHRPSYPQASPWSRRHSVRHPLIERNETPIRLPKMERCNTCATEIFRRMAIAEMVRDAGLPLEAPMGVFLAPSMADLPIVNRLHPSVAQAKSAHSLSSNGEAISRAPTGARRRQGFPARRIRGRASRPSLAYARAPAWLQSQTAGVR